MNTPTKYDPWAGWRSEKKEEKKPEEKKTPEEQAKENAQKIAKKLSEVEERKERYLKAIKNFAPLIVLEGDKKLELEAKLYIEKLKGNHIPGYIQLAYLTESTYSSQEYGKRSG